MWKLLVLIGWINGLICWNKIIGIDSSGKQLFDWNTQLSFKANCKILINR